MVDSRSKKEHDEFVDAFGDYDQLRQYRDKLEKNHSQPEVRSTSITFNDVSTKNATPMTITNFNTQITINNRYPGFRSQIDLTSSPSKRFSLSNKILKESKQKIIDRLEESKKENTQQPVSEPMTSLHESDLDEQTSEETVQSIRSQTISENSTPNRLSSINPVHDALDSGSKGDLKILSHFSDSPRLSIDKDQSPSTKQRMKRSGFGTTASRKKFDFLYKREATKLHDLAESHFKDLILLQDIPREAFAIEPTKITKGSANSIWVVRFSPNENFIATGGADGLLRIFNLSAEIRMQTGTPGITEPEIQLINPKPLVFSKHTSDIVDLDWNKDSRRILTASIDNKAILWDITLSTPLQIFEHGDIVPCTRFHPMVDDFCLTGCFDKILRIWDIADKKVVDWIQTADMITAMCFSPDKEFLLVGFFEGAVKIYRASQGKLKAEMEIECKNNPSLGKSKKTGKKVTEIFFFDENEFLVTTNDSRMRLYNFNSYEMILKYKGNTNKRYQIRPDFK